MAATTVAGLGLLLVGPVRGGGGATLPSAAEKMLPSLFIEGIMPKPVRENGDVWFTSNLYCNATLPPSREPTQTLLAISHSTATTSA